LVCIVRSFRSPSLKGQHRNDHGDGLRFLPLGRADVEDQPTVSCFGLGQSVPQHHVGVTALQRHTVDAGDQLALAELAVRRRSGHRFLDLKSDAFIDAQLEAGDADVAEVLLPPRIRPGVEKRRLRVIAGIRAGGRRRRTDKPSHDGDNQQTNVSHA
jgi:hypothetical protein